MALMTNYDRALQLEQEALNSNGAAMERYAIYQESITAKEQELKAAFEDFVYSEATQEMIKAFYDLAESGVEILKIASPILNFLTQLAAAVANVLSAGLGTVADLLGFIGKVVSNGTLETNQEKAERLTSEIADIEGQIATINENPINLDAETQVKIIHDLNEELERTKELLGETQEEVVVEDRKNSYIGTDSKGDELNLDNYLLKYTEYMEAMSLSEENVNYLANERNRIEEEYQTKLQATQDEIDRISEKLERSKEAGDDTWGQTLYTNRLEDLQNRADSLTKSYEKQRKELSILQGEEAVHRKSLEETRKTLVSWLKEVYNNISALQEEGEELSLEEETFLEWASHIPEITNSVDDLDNELEESKDIIDDHTHSVEDNAGALQDDRDAAKDLASDILGLASTIERLDKEYNVCNKALKEFQSEGRLSARTAIELVNANNKFAGALEVVDGQITLNIQKLQELQQQAIIAANATYNATKTMTLAQLEESYEMSLVMGNMVYAAALKKQIDAVKESMLPIGTGGYIQWTPPSNSSTSSGSSSSSSSASDKDNAYLQSLKDKQDLFKTYLKYIVDAIDKEINALKEEKSTWDKFYDDKIDALREMEEAEDEEKKRQEYLLEIEEKRAELAKANQQVVRTYVRNVGFIYKTDMEAVAAAQEEFNKSLQAYEEWEHKVDIDKRVKDLEEAKDKIKDNIDEQIDKLEELKDKWQDSLDITEDTDKYKDLLDDIKDFENANYDERLNMLEEFIDAYKNLLGKLNAVSSSGGGSGGGGGWSVGGSGGTVTIKPNGVVERVPDVTPSSPNYVVGSGDSGYVGPSTSNPDTGWDGPTSSRWQEEYGGSTTSYPSSSSSSSSSSGSSSSSTTHTSADFWEAFGYTGSWASGSKSIPNDHLALVGEEGPELRVLRQGDGIVPSDLTENLMEWGRLRPSDIFGSLPTFESAFTPSGNSEIYNMSFDSIVLPDVSDFSSFKDALMNESRNYAIQIQSERR